MTSESEPVSKNNQTPDASRKPDTQTAQGNPNIPGGPSISTPRPTKPHCEITCKPEKTFWDHVKTGGNLRHNSSCGLYRVHDQDLLCQP